MNGMISCKNCSAHNSLDSTFCKRCGANLPADDIQQAKEKLEAVVADGYKIFAAGRTDEAMQIAETSVAANPSSTAALSLKAMCHERLGQISEALECHERVLAIDPDSMIDKIKVNDLRNLLVARSSIAAVPDRRMAIVGAVAAFVLVASIGVVIAKGAGGGDDRVASNLPIKSKIEDPNISRFDASSPAPGVTKPDPAKQTPNTETVSNPNPDINRQAQNPTMNMGSGGSSVQLPPANRDGHLPDVNIGGGDGNTPLILNPDKNVKDTLKNQNQNSAPPQGPGPEKGDPPPVDNPPAQKQEAPGIMEIKVVSRNGQPTEAGAKDPGLHANGVEALLRTARNQYQVGEYGSAANSYERALRAGADPASTNQRLAQCYEKLNRNSDAAAAYGRAVASYQADLDSGRGDKSRLSAAIESCKQAIKVLGG